MLDSPTANTAPSFPETDSVVITTGTKQDSHSRILLLLLWWCLLALLLVMHL
jgi:tetrahydromethanopterin S-methyltransferase subunit B